jgi:hypothetical protein
MDFFFFIRSASKKHKNLRLHEVEKIEQETVQDNIREEEIEMEEDCVIFLIFHLMTWINTR